jgi:hypothetical protein
MSLNQQMRIITAPLASEVNFTIFSESGKQVDIMKDGRVVAWTSDQEKTSIVRHQTYKSCSIYRNLDCFNALAHYYKGEIAFLPNTTTDQFDLQGHGEMFWPNGDHYVGQFDCGFLDGQGEYTCRDGRKYVGTFDCDQIEGKGVMVWPDGSSYEGVFFDGKIDPKSTSPRKFTFPNGDIFIGDPFGQLSTLVDLKSDKYSCLLQQAEPKAGDSRLMQPDVEK